MRHLAREHLSVPRPVRRTARQAHRQHQLDLGVVVPDAAGAVDALDRRAAGDRIRDRRPHGPAVAGLDALEARHVQTTSWSHATVALARGQYRPGLASVSGARGTRRHERDRRAEPGLAAQRRDPPPRLHRVTHRAQQLAERLGRRLEVGDDEGDAPQPRRAVGIGGDAAALRACTSSRINSPRRKNACRGAPPGVGSSRTRRRSMPAPWRTVVVRSRAGVMATTWSIATTPLG